MKITITRAEGPSHLCGKPYEASSFEEAQRILWNMSTTGPRIGYDKCDFKIEDAAIGLEYDGRYDLVHFSIEPPDLKSHCTGFLRFMGGAGKPLSMSEDTYQRFLNRRVPGLARRQEYLDVADWLEQQP
jgi:hypothetical protein